MYGRRSHYCRLEDWKLWMLWNLLTGRRTGRASLYFIDLDYCYQPWVWSYRRVSGGPMFGYYVWRCRCSISWDIVSESIVDASIGFANHKWNCWDMKPWEGPGRSARHLHSYSIVWLSFYSRGIHLDALSPSTRFSCSKPFVNVSILLSFLCRPTQLPCFYCIWN
jgi:hypothetical protein